MMSCQISDFRNRNNLKQFLNNPMSRNSIEKRSTMLEKSWVNRSRCNPESTTSINLGVNLPTKPAKYQDSQVSIRNPCMDTNSLETRYEALQKSYKGLMAKIGVQNQSVNDQAKQIKRLKGIHDNNEKEIMRLRGMLGFLDKQDKGTQTIAVQRLQKPVENMNVKSCIHISKYSNHSSKDHSKIMSSMNMTSSESQTKISSPISTKSIHRPSSNVKLSRTSKYLLNDSGYATYCNKEERCASPGGLKERYKFIPSLPLA